jgi:hypothetical protein
MLSKTTKTNPVIIGIAAGFNLAAQFFLIGLWLFPMIVQDLYVKFY